jgi:DnaJ-class molecular chaperone
MQDPYKVLGIPKNADTDTIKKAYKRLARKYHPDRNQGEATEQKFKDVNAANDVLSDSKKRKLYDQFGEIGVKDGFNPGAGGPGPGFSWGTGGPGGAGQGFNVEDLLGSMFGGGAGPRRKSRSRGINETTTLKISVLTSFIGGDTTFTLKRSNNEQATLKVRVPAGAKHGSKLRLKGKGLPRLPGGPCGDLIVELLIEEHPLLKRNGDHLEMELPIGPLEALQGCQLAIPTPTGEVKVRIPPGSQSGQRLRLKGRGIQKKSPGDLYLSLKIMMPEENTEPVIEAARTLQAGLGRDIRKDLKL